MAVGQTILCSERADRVKLLAMAKQLLPACLPIGCDIEHSFAPLCYHNMLVSRRILFFWQSFCEAILFLAFHAIKKYRSNAPDY